MKQRKFFALPTSLAREGDSFFALAQRKKLFHTYPAPSLPMEGDSYFTLAQRKYQRDIHPHQGLPLYGEDATRIIAETDDFPLFWYRGTRDDIKHRRDTR